MNKKSKALLVLCCTFIISITVIAAIDITSKNNKINDAIKSAVALSQDPTWGTTRYRMYKTPEGVVLDCDERHGFANGSKGQFVFGLNDDEIAENHWKDKDYDWYARPFTNGQIIKAVCYDANDNIIHEEFPEKAKPMNSVRIDYEYDGTQCDRFILYILYNDAMYSAECEIVQRTVVVSETIENAIKSAVALSQDPTWGTTRYRMYKTPEGVVLDCDERHGFANGSKGQFVFGLNDDEIAENHWKDEDYDWHARPFTNGQIIKAVCYDANDNIIHEEFPKEDRVVNSVRIDYEYDGTQCRRFILYILYKGTAYSAECEIVEP